MFNCSKIKQPGENKYISPLHMKEDILKYGSCCLSYFCSQADMPSSSRGKTLRTLVPSRASNWLPSLAQSAHL